MKDAEIKRFCQKHNLSQRESEVFEVILQGTINFRDVAERLKISPNTVNNHLNNIFGKTNTKSKGELLSSFLDQVFTSVSKTSNLQKTPEVIVVDDEQDICDVIAAELRQQDLRVHVASNASDALSLLKQNKIDAVVSDIRMPDMTGVELLHKIRENYGYHPFVLFITGFSDFKIDQVMDWGAVGMLEKPFEVEDIYPLIMEHFVEEELQKQTFLAVDSKDFDKKDIQEPLRVSKRCLGYGGVFIPSSTWTNGESFKNFQVGEKIQFHMQVEDADLNVPALGQIEWKRNQAEEGDLSPGMGVRFLSFNDGDRERVREVVKKDQIFSFIPRNRSV